MAQQEAPEVGAVIDGYRFKGGNPAQQSSWEAVAPPGARLLPRGRATGDRRSEEAYWGRRRTQGDPAVTQAEQGVAASRRAEGLLARQEAQGQGTGGIYGVPILGTVAGFLDPEIRELNALQARQARLERQPGEGAISDFDAAQFVAMTYGADKPMETNRALIQAQRVINDATLQKREFDEWYFGQYGTTAGSQEAWRVYAQENPIFDPSSQRGEGPARINGERQNWRQYFTGEQGLDTQADIDARSLDGTEALLGPDDPATGLPTYPTIQGGREIAVPPAGPGASAEMPIDLTTASRDEVIAAIQRGGWFRQGPDGEPYELPASTPEFGAQAGDEMVSPGVAVRPRITSSPEDQAAIESRSGVPGWWRGVESFAQAATERFPGLDEAAAWTAAKLSGVSTDEARAVQRDVADYDRANYRTQRNLGGIAGVASQIPVGMGAASLAPRALQLAPRVAGATGWANAGRLATNALRVAAPAGATGAVYGAGEGEGSLAERGDEALAGGVLGAVAAPIVGAAARPVINNVLAPVGRSIARPIAALGERFGVPGAAEASRRLAPNVLEGAVDRYGARFNPDAGVLAQRADELEALGIEPRFINLVGDARQGTFRALNTRGTDDMGTAREVASRLPQTMRRNLPTRVRRIAEEEVSPESRPTLEVMDELSAARRANAQSGSQDFNAENVRLDDNVAAALRSPVARSSLTQAAAVMEGSLDPAERQSAEYIRQLASGEAGRGAMMTVREVQDVTQALNTAARSAFNSENPTAGPTLSALARTIRDQGRQQSEGYRNWLTQYADDSQLLEAATTGRNFVTADTNPINVRSTDAFVRQAEQAAPPELMMQRAAARGAMEAQGSGPTGARSVLENLTSNLDQQRRATALGLDAPRLAARSEAELRVLEDAQRVSPRVGSETGTNIADQAAEAAAAGSEVLRGDVPGILGRLGRRFMSRGFNDQQAEAISLAAMDPTRTREVIDMLATRMNRQEARSMLRAIRFSAARGAGEYAGDEE